MKKCKLYADAKIPPCAEYLNNDSPIIKNGKLIYRNLNRLFLFISVHNNPNSIDTFNVNIQISLAHYIIGLFLHEILSNSKKYDENCKITSDPKINSTIHKMIQNPPKSIKEEYIYSLVLIYSNKDAVLPPINYSIRIKPLVFYILLVLNRIDNNPGLFFVNNGHVTEDTINFMLSSLHFTLPINDLYNLD